MAWTTSVHANPYNKTNKTITHHTGGESYGRYTSGIVWILYIVLGYWSVGQTIYANKIIIGPMGTLWIKRFILGFMFGWVLIPIAIIKCLIFR